jgi:hypothetical protein
MQIHDESESPAWQIVIMTDLRSASARDARRVRRMHGPPEMVHNSRATRGSSHKESSIFSNRQNLSTAVSVVELKHRGFRWPNRHSTWPQVSVTVNLTRRQTYPKFGRFGKPNNYGVFWQSIQSFKFNWTVLFRSVQPMTLLAQCATECTFYCDA